ncbi:MAG: hypothetical protein HC828_06545 [Blastochloris sp.]|nr:hypothetical protein [Blastochloris sp.]
MARTSKNESEVAKLRLIIVHSTEIYIPLNLNESPFNVGICLELPDFNVEQVQILAQRDRVNLTLPQIQQLMQKVGGHPYLTRQAISQLRNHSNLSLEALLDAAATESGIYSAHLRHLWNLLQRRSELVEAFKQVVNTDYPIRLEPSQAYQLQSIGLIKFAGNAVVIRCDLYRQYFRDRLE